MGYQITLDLGLCIIKSVPQRCPLTISDGYKHTDDQKAATAFPSKTSFNRPVHGIISPPSKIKKSQSPCLHSIISKQVRWMKHLDEPYICAWHEVHTGSDLGRPSSPHPDNST